MNPVLWSLWAIYPPVAALCIAQPWFSRRNVLFSVVFADDAAWREPAMRAVRRVYLWRAVAAGVVVGAAGLVLSAVLRLGAGGDTGIFTAAIFIMLGAMGVLFALAHARVRRLKAAGAPRQGLEASRVTVELGTPDRQAVLSAWWVLLLLALPLAGAVVALAGYGRLPARIAMHYNAVWTPDSFADKSWAVALFPMFTQLFMAAVFVVSYLFMRRAPASVRGNPQAAPGAARFRRVMAALFLAIGVLAQAELLLVELLWFLPVPVWAHFVLLGATLALTAALFVVYFHLVRVKKPRGPILDDDARWVLGLFYYNPGDPSVFVEKRSGIGYTVNFGHPLGWAFFLGIIAFVVLVLVLAPHGRR